MLSMEKSRQLWKNALRWIGILPVSIVAYVVSKLLSNWSFGYVDPELVRDIDKARDFADHYILGPMFVFQREGTATGIAIYTGVYLAPSYKKVVFFILVGLWVIMLLVASFFIGATVQIYEWTTGAIIRTVLELIAQLVAIIVVGYYLWEESKKGSGQLSPRGV